MILNNKHLDRFESIIKRYFKHTFTAQQKDLIQGLKKFIFTVNTKDLFIISGYAGTGKSSLIGAIVKSLEEIDYSTCLLAPTGRATKVLAEFSNKKSSTIHRKIYHHTKNKNGSFSTKLSINKSQNTLFIIDESSMIPDQSNNSGGNNLLDDLISYIYSGKNCKLIFIGDTGQLPPVGSLFSPALSLEYLKEYYPSININIFHLNEVVRQKEKSGIIVNATNTRSSKQMNFLEWEHFNDVEYVEGRELQDTIEQSYDNTGISETIIITRSNKRANEYNNQIRKRLLWKESSIEKGDIIMVTKNNYFWAEKGELLANGEMFEVVKIMKEEFIYEMDFINIRIRGVNNKEEKDLVIFKELLENDSPNLSWDILSNLYKEIAKDFDYISNKKDLKSSVLSNKYYNALQVKFSYAVTCHKAQGGQWDNVFIDLGYITKDRINKEFMRWLYTAITRAKRKVFLINFPDYLLKK